MTLKYVGPKPTISHRGIVFDNNKEDKYVYFNVVVQLIKALDHDYIEDKSYVYEERTELSSRDIIFTLEKYCPNLNRLLDKKSHCVEDEIQENLMRTHENHFLSEDDKQVLENNINIMHDYMIQREVNKAVYYCAMGVLADIAKKDHIDHITTPMFQKYVHVLHSLQGTLLAEKVPVDTKMDIFKNDNGLFVTLKVVNILQEANNKKEIDRDAVCHIMNEGEVLNTSSKEYPLYEAVLYGSRVSTAKFSKRLSCAIKYLPLRLKFHFEYDTQKAVDKGIGKDPTLMLGNKIFLDGLVQAEEITKAFEKFLK